MVEKNSSDILTNEWPTKQELGAIAELATGIPAAYIPSGVLSLMELNHNIAEHHNTALVLGAIAITGIGLTCHGAKKLYFSPRKQNEEK